MLKPVGTLPLSPKLVAAGDVVFAKEKATLVTPVAEMALVKTGAGLTGAGGAAIDRVSVTVALVPKLFDAVRLTEEVPAAVGVPLITPVVVLTERPAGRP